MANMPTKIQDRIDAVSRAAGDVLRAARPDGPCLICSAPIGTKHKANCAVWPLILTRHELDTGERIEQILE